MPQAQRWAAAAGVARRLTALVGSLDAMKREREFEDQEEFDRIPTCRWCGATCESGMDFCPACGRKVTQDRSSGRRGEQDMTDGLARNFGHRLDDWLNDDVREDDDTYEDIREYTFERE